MTLVDVIIKSQEKMELETVKAKVPEINASVELYKQKLLTYLNDVYIKFSELPNIKNDLIYKADQLQKEVHTMKDVVISLKKNTIDPAKEDLNMYSTALKNCTGTLDLLKQLCFFHTETLVIKSELKSRAYVNCMKLMHKLNEYVNNLPNDICLDLRRGLVASLRSTENALLFQLSEDFTDIVQINVKDNTCNLNIKNDNVKMLTEILSSLYIYNTSIKGLNDVTLFLWDNFFVSIVNFKTNVELITESTYSTLSIEVTNKAEKNLYYEVFSNIKKVLEFMLSNFNIEIAEGVSTLTYIGRDICDNLSELIIKNCLKDTVPCTQEELQIYAKVVESTEDLEKALFNCNFFFKDTTSILAYVNNIEVLFIEKKCEEYMKKAESFMKKHLHDMVEVDTQVDTVLLVDKNILDNTCSKYFVSSSVLDLIYLVNEIISSAVSTSDKVAAERLYLTVYNICNNYPTIVFEYHQKLLHTIPQQMALYYNNCIYFSLQLTKLNVPKAQKDNASTEMSTHLKFVFDVSYKIKEVGENKMNEFIEKQIDQIQATLNDAGLNKLTLDEIDDKTEKCLRQCLRQQELLKTVWQKVLLVDDYNKRIGKILNSMTNFLIEYIVHFTDVSTNAATQLVELLKMIQTRGPKLFTDPKEISFFVSSWYKLNELVFILNAGLSDINDRWADGKGPLGLHFTPDEIKQMIRALFQNTDRRRALLEKII